MTLVLGVDGGGRKPSAVVVSTEDGEETLNQPFERATASFSLWSIRLTVRRKPA